MLTIDSEYLRRRMDGLPKADLADAMIAAAAKIGGAPALLRALDEAQTELARRRTRRRARVLAPYEASR